MNAAALRCPALLIAAPASGQGKTSVTAALARAQARRGRRVRVFKCGQDFLDPQWLELASGHPVDNLDLWMNGEAIMRPRLVALGPQAWVMPWGELRGHTFHYSETQMPLPPYAHTTPARAHGRPEAIWRHGSVMASYFHAWFASAAQAAAQLFLPQDARAPAAPQEAAA